MLNLSKEHMLEYIFGNHVQVKEVAANVFGAAEMRWKALALIALQEVVCSDVNYSSIASIITVH